jgi:hypothetical protein
VTRGIVPQTLRDSESSPREDKAAALNPPPRMGR